MSSEPLDDRVSLAVPYEEKDAAKALGARWDPELRAWYVPRGRDLLPFCRWLPPDSSDPCPVAQHVAGRTPDPGSVTVYLGYGAGGELRERIKTAERSITVVSPYLAPYLVDILLERQRHGVEVTLLTAEDEARRPEIARRLIAQECEANPAARHRRRLGMGWSLGVATLLMAVGALGWRFDARFALALAVVPFALLTFLCCWAIRVYFYAYRFAFSRTKVLRSPFPRDGHLHAKLMLVDGVLFLGSMNFTHMGLVRNVESCVRLTDPVSIDAAARQVDQLLNQSHGVEPRALARWLFPEPPHSPPK